MGLLGKPHRHDSGLDGCWCSSITEVAIPTLADKKQKEPTCVFYRLWIEYKNGQNWCIERDTSQEVMEAISDGDVKYYEITRFCGNTITKEELCAL